MAEIWDLVDKDGNKIGLTWERSNHDNIPDGVYHPCVEVWVKVGDKLLITRRHPDKSDGLKYDLPGGAVVSGEDITHGALRELWEEVGIKVEIDDLSLMGHLAFGKVFAASYIVRLPALPELRLQPTEVVSYKLVSEEEFVSMESELTKGSYRRYLIYKDQIF